MIAPDMPWFGKSSSRHIHEDYSVENIVRSQLALLPHLDRTKAVWIAHDWGTATMWGLASELQRSFAPPRESLSRTIR